MGRRKKYKPLKGRKIGRLKVLSRYKLWDTKYYYKCRCDCGKIIILHIGSLQTGRATQCHDCVVKEGRTKGRPNLEPMSKERKEEYRNKLKDPNYVNTAIDTIAEDFANVFISGMFTTDYLKACIRYQKKQLKEKL
jgi:hypothetical protein